MQHKPGVFLTIHRRADDAREMQFNSVQEATCYAQGYDHARLVAGRTASRTGTPGRRILDEDVLRWTPYGPHQDCERPGDVRYDIRVYEPDDPRRR